MSSNRIKSNKIQVGESFVLPLEQTNLTRQQAKIQQLIEESDNKAKEIIENAQDRSNIVIQAANTEADNIIQNARKKGNEDYEIIKNEAYKEGFKKGEEDGLAKFKEDSLEALKSLEDLCNSTYELKKNIIDSATRDIVEIIIAIANKVCNSTFNDRVLYKLTTDAIKLLCDKENITIIINPKLINNISRLVPEIRNEIPKLQTLKILEDNSLSPDGVIVETPETRLDSRISTQIAEIAEKMLMGANNGMGQE